MTDLATVQEWAKQDAAAVAARAVKVQALTEREERALDAYAMGMSYSSIATLLGVKTASAAQKVVDRALERRAALQNHQGLDKARARLLHTTDLMLQRWMPLAMGGDKDAAKVVDDQLKRVERLLGLAAPKQHEHHHEIEVNVLEQRKAAIVANLQAFADRTDRTIEGEIAE